MNEWIFLERKDINYSMSSGEHKTYLINHLSLCWSNRKLKYVHLTIEGFSTELLQISPSENFSKNFYADSPSYLVIFWLVRTRTFLISKWLSYAFQMDFFGGSFTSEWICTNPKLFFLLIIATQKTWVLLPAPSLFLIYEMRQDMMTLILTNAYYGLPIIDCISFIKIKGSMFVLLIPLFHEKA